MTYSTSTATWLGPGWTFSNNKIYKLSGTNNLKYLNTTREVSSNKSYYFKIHLSNLSNFTSNILKLNVNWGDNFDILFSQNNGVSDYSDTNGYIYFNSSPLNNSEINNFINFDASSSFDVNYGIFNLQMIELDWEICGLSWINDNPDLTTLNSRTFSNETLYCNGWSYNVEDNVFVWYNLNTNSLTRNFSPVGGIPKRENVLYNRINHLSKYIGFQDFNLSFNYTKGEENPDTDLNAGIKIYLSDTEPPVNTNEIEFERYLQDATLISELNYNGSLNVNYIGLTGNKYIVIVGDEPDSDDQNVLIALSNIKIKGGYSNNNNSLFNVDPNTFKADDIKDSIFSTIVGNGVYIVDSSDTNDIKIIKNTLEGKASQLTSKIGNSYFNRGVWENGVWNSGYRKDETVKEMYNIIYSIKTLSDIRWNIRISGPSETINELNIGDRVSISNIIGIDINGNRKIIRGLYTIILKGNGFIDINIETTFPLMRIEKDSQNHRILISKNVWLSGGFLNGVFNGIWNYGLYKGYPLITKTDNSHWIDGIFDGGHFKGMEYLFGDFESITYEDGMVRLNFNTPHNLTEGDIIEISKDDKNINPQYDGEQRVLRVVNNESLILDLQWGQTSESNESGTYKTNYTTSLIQNMNFKSNNVSKLTSNITINSPAVFNYNSWIDVVYQDETAVNIGKPQTVLNKASRKYYSENNLYGYPTNDVLSSKSIFRDSYSLNKREYKLGTKFKKFDDYVGESSEFKDFFGSNGSDLELFLEKGWSYSIPNNNNQNITSDVLFNRTESLGGLSNIQGEELNIKATGEGAVLDLSKPEVEVLGRVNSEIPKNRYVAVEFDLIDYNLTEEFYRPPLNSIINGNTFTSISSKEPIIHFDNINKTNRLEKLELLNGNTEEVIQLTQASYLPIFENINHIKTKKKRKIEYFFNKRHLSMNIRGNGLIGEYETDITIDNLKIFEVNMIPFFKYFKDNNINKSIQVPFKGISPFIDYSDNDFDFIDNIDISLSKIDLNTDNIDFDDSNINIGIDDTIEDEIPNPPPNPGSGFEIPVLSQILRIDGENRNVITLQLDGDDFKNNAYLPVKLNLRFIIRVEDEDIIFNQPLSIDIGTNESGKLTSVELGNDTDFVNSLQIFKNTIFENSLTFANNPIIDNKSFEIVRNQNDRISIACPIITFTNSSNEFIRYEYYDVNSTVNLEVFGTVPPPPVVNEDIKAINLDYLLGSGISNINPCDTSNFQIDVGGTYYIDNQSNSIYPDILRANNIYLNEQGTILADSGWYKNNTFFLAQEDDWRYWDKSFLGNGSFTNNIRCSSNDENINFE